MRAIDDATVNRVERNELSRALALHEKKAAELREMLGLVSRETFTTVTPSTLPEDGVTRMRTDQLDRLYESGKLSADQRAAALKIRTIWEAMSRGLYPGGGFGGGGGKSRGTFRHPLERMTNREFFIWSQEYKPWAAGAAARVAIDREAHDTDGITFNFRKSYLQVCYEVIVEGFGPSQLEQKWPIPRGKGVIVNVLRTGLNLWDHKDFDPDVDLDDLREEILVAARKKIEETKPARAVR